MQRSADEKSIHTHIAAKKVRKKHTPTKLICFADTRTTNKRNSKCVTFIIQIFDLTLPQATIKWNISNFGRKITQKAAATITTCTSNYSTNAFSAIECHSVERVRMRCLRSHQYVLAHNTNLYISFAACILEKFAAACRKRVCSIPIINFWMGLTTTYYQFIPKIERAYMLGNSLSFIISRFK